MQEIYLLLLRKMLILLWMLLKEPFPETMVEIGLLLLALFVLAIFEPLLLRFLILFSIFVLHGLQHQIMDTFNFRTNCACLVLFFFSFVTDKREKE